MSPIPCTKHSSNKDVHERTEHVVVDVSVQILCFWSRGLLGVLNWSGPLSQEKSERPSGSETKPDPGVPPKKFPANDYSSISHPGTRLPIWGSLPWTYIAPCWSTRQYIIAQGPVGSTNITGQPPCIIPLCIVKLRLWMQKS